MKHRERVEDYLEHIGQAIRRATDYADHLENVSAFRQSQRDQDAVMVTVTQIDRLARSTSDLFAIVKQIVDTGGQFRSLPSRGPIPPLAPGA